MVTQQILVLLFLVRVRVSQQKEIQLSEIQVVGFLIAQIIVGLSFYGSKHTLFTKLGMQLFLNNCTPHVNKNRHCWQSGAKIQIICGLRNFLLQKSKIYLRVLYIYIGMESKIGLESYETSPISQT